MKQLLREPFVHFALLGVLVFAADAYLRSRSAEAGAGEIVVSAGRIDNLAALYERTWQRPPTPEALRSVVDGYVLEEALYREGLSLGVDQGDAVIRRRVRQKVDFFIDDLVDDGQTSDAELETWLAEHPESYAEPARYWFRQVFVNADERGEPARADAEDILAQLRSPDDVPDSSQLGDQTLLQPAYADMRSDVVASSFGEPFAAELAGLPNGEWSGPVESAFGLHLIYIDSKTPARNPSLSEVRAQVERDWGNAQRELAADQFYQDVVSRYDVTVEWNEFVESLGEAERPVNLAEESSELR